MSGHGKVKKTLDACRRNARRWFMKEPTITRAIYDGRGELNDSGEGAVYAYFRADGRAMYVGQTGGRVKTRAHFKTSKHKDALWWSKWRSMRFIQIPNQVDRFALESLLILELKPIYNRTPKAKAFRDATLL